MEQETKISDPHRGVELANMAKKINQYPSYPTIRQGFARTTSQETTNNIEHRKLKTLVEIESR